MSFYITMSCVGCKDMSCTEVCPADCIYEGDQKLYINPNECVKCGACELACPAEAIEFIDDQLAKDEPLAADNALFFSTVLPGKNEPLGKPRGARKFGRVGVDTPFVSETKD